MFWSTVTERTVPAGITIGFGAGRSVFCSAAGADDVDGLGDTGSAELELLLSEGVADLLHPAMANSTAIASHPVLADIFMVFLFTFNILVAAVTQRGWPS